MCFEILYHGSASQIEPVKLLAEIIFRILFLKVLRNGSHRLRLSSFPYTTAINSSTYKPPLLLHTHHLKPHYSCKDIRALKHLHASLVVSTGLVEPTSSASKLISLYAQFNDLDSAAQVFKGLIEPNTFLWNSIIKAHIDNNLVDSALLLYKCMRELGVAHDTFTFPIMNRAVLLLQNSFQCGELIHCLAIRMGFDSDVYFCNSMIDVYVKCGEFGYGIQLFDEMPQRDLVSWTSMISGYVSEGNAFGAFQMFNNLLRIEFEPNHVTVMVMLRGCCDNVNGGIQLHGYVLKNGLLINLSVRNSILQMYTIGGIDDAEVLFGEFEDRDVVTWNIIISFYSLKRDDVKLANCFHVMQGKSMLSIESLTLLVSALTDVGNLSHGKQVHCLSVKSGLDDSILKTSFLDFYAKCKDMESSEQLFGEIPHPSYITWNAMMTASIYNGFLREAIELFRKMIASGLEPSAESLENLILAYSHVGALLLGKGIHAYVIKNFLSNFEEKTAPLKTSILNMYIRCGSIGAAKIFFDKLASRDLVTWTSMIEGLGTHGLGHQALQLFHSMVEEGIEPNSVTFLGLLSACSHSGLVREGCESFYSMKWRFGIEPGLNHYTCIVDLLGRSGMLKEALAIILKLVAFTDSRIWGALLSASRLHENHLLAEFAAKRLFELEPDNAGYHTLLSNVQASVEGWSEVEDIRGFVKDNNLIKQPGWSCIEAEGSIHGFVAGDRSHSQVVDIFETLGSLSRKMQDSWYVIHC